MPLGIIGESLVSRNTQFSKPPMAKCAYMCIGTHLSALLYHYRDSACKGPARGGYHAHVMIEPYETVPDHTRWRFRQFTAPFPVRSPSYYYFQKRNADAVTAIMWWRKLLPDDQEPESAAGARLCCCPLIAALSQYFTFDVPAVGLLASLRVPPK